MIGIGRFLRFAPLAAASMVLFSGSQAYANGGAFFADESATNSDSHGSVYFGDVRDTSGKGVPDATVTIQGKEDHHIIYQVHTANTGHYQSGQVDVDPNLTAVSVAKTTYRPTKILSLTKTLAKDQPVETDFIVAPAGAS